MTQTAAVYTVATDSGIAGQELGQQIRHVFKGPMIDRPYDRRPRQLLRGSDR